MKYCLITFGCQMNKSDSERIAAVLEKMGYKRTSKENEADLIVVNMCSVRQSAVDRVFGLIPKFEKLREKNLNLKTILTGCILKKDKEKFKNRFDLILDIKNLPIWPKIIKKEHYTLFCHGRIACNEHLEVKPKYENNFSAYVPISIGCNNFCSYCVVPFTRGLLICRPHNEILKEVKNAVKKGFKEIWLLGQNVNRYNSRIKTNTNSRIFANNKIRENSREINFANLLKMVNDIRGSFWLRFTSPNPKDFSDELIETMAKCQKVTPYLNLPVQSGDNEILKRMNRGYTFAYYKNLVKKIREKFAEIREGLGGEVAISTDIIVGFPSETKKQFNRTAKLLKAIKFDMAYIAQYSPRPGTAAFKLKDNVSYQEKEKRWKILTDILKKMALKRNKKFIGKTIDVLIDRQENGFLFGKSKHYKTVKIHNSKFLIRNSNFVGKFIKVRIIGANPFGLKGTLSIKNKEETKIAPQNSFSILD